MACLRPLPIVSYPSFFQAVTTPLQDHSVSKTAIEALSSDYSTAFSSTCQESLAQKASIHTIAQKFALHLHCKYNTSQLYLCNYFGVNTIFVNWRLWEVLK